MKNLRNKWMLGVLTLTAIVAFESPAWPQDRVSGLLTRTYIIVEDTDLVGDVTCDVTNSPCFSFGASDVELRLNGFAITGKADAVTACGGASFGPEAGINTSGRSNVGVRGPGLVQRFRSVGVNVSGSSRDVRIQGITASTNCASGIFVGAASFGTLVEGNVAVRNGSAAAGFGCGGI